MEGHRKSDRVVVPEKRPNNAPGAAEDVEERTLTKGNTKEPAAPRMQSREHGVSRGLGRVREAAQRDKEQKFTGLLHHIDEEALSAAQASTGAGSSLPGFGPVGGSDGGPRRPLVRRIAPR